MKAVPLGELMAERNASVDPAKHPAETFELWSIPAYDLGKPDILSGSEIGSSKKHIQPGDVLLSRIVPHIRRAWVVTPNEKGIRQIGSSEWIVFRSKSVFPHYLKEFLISDLFHAQFMQTVAGVGGSLLRARPDGVKEIRIPLPPLDEQKRIAAILDQADALRRLRQRAIDRLNELGQAIFYEMFGDPLEKSRGFNELRLADVGTLERGVSKHRPRNDPALLGGPYPLVQTGDVASATNYLRTHTATYSDIGLKQSRMWPKGTLCITIAANIGKTAILDFPACFPDSVVGFTPNTNVTLEFALYWFKGIQRNLEAYAPQSAQKNINLEILRDLPIAVPPRDQQEAFSSAIQQIDAESCRLSSGIHSLDRLFSSLQHRAFTGQL